MRTKLTTEKPCPEGLDLTKTIAELKAMGYSHYYIRCWRDMAGIKVNKGSSGKFKQLVAYTMEHIKEEDWAQGYSYVAKLLGKSRVHVNSIALQIAKITGKRPGNRKNTVTQTVPEGLNLSLPIRVLVREKGYSHTQIRLWRKINNTEVTTGVPRTPLGLKEETAAKYLKVSDEDWAKGALHIGNLVGVNPSRVYLVARMLGRPFSTKVHKHVKRKKDHRNLTVGEIMRADDDMWDGELELWVSLSDPTLRDWTIGKVYEPSLITVPVRRHIRFYQDAPISV